MKLLVIGGTRFIGRHLVSEAVARGHEVTLFNRGSLPAPDGVAEVTLGDRDHDLEKLAGGSWDAVIDNVAYFPRQVRELVAAVAGRARHYTLVSTVSVYAEQDKAGLNEDSALLELADPSSEELTNESYGGLKVLCERELAASFPGSRLVIRPGLIVGPHDPTDRFTYWPARVAMGGAVLAPVGPEMPLQWIDVRDLATWMLDAAEAGLEGTFNAVSQAGRFIIGELLDASLTASGSGAEVVWAPESFLLEHEVRPFADLPLWIPADGIGFWHTDGSRAIAAGLKVRSVQDTVSATLDWYRSRLDPQLRVGLTREREAQLVDAWRAKMAGHGRVGDSD